METLNAHGVRRVVQLLVFVALLGGALFGLAGRVDWPQAWAFVTTLLMYMVVMSVWGIRNDPALLNERGRAVSRPTSRSERSVVRAVGALQVALFVVAGLDAGRNGWSTVPLAAQAVGWLLLAVAIWMVSWAMTTNTYVSVEVRIQAERGHRVITTGPYAYVRHPMYVGAILGGAAIPLVLGSWWAFFPGLALATLFAFRTAYEDRVLNDDLPGVPGVRRTGYAPAGPWHLVAKRSDWRSRGEGGHRAFGLD